MDKLEYLEKEVAENTTYKSIKEAYQRNKISIVKNGSVFWLEQGHVSKKTYDIIVNETKRIFPQLKYLYDFV